MSLKGKKILLGVSGGIAAYKTCELVRLFKKDGAEVRVIMTPSAVNFVSPITLSALSGNEVLINIFPQTDLSKTEIVETKTWHVYTGLWADVFIIAPATANTIAKIVTGICDNFLTATVLASRCPVVVAPSMDEYMYENEITKQNISKLKELGYFVLEPESGELASGLYGIGRMPEPHTIFEYTDTFLKDKKKDLQGKKILVTAGPTYEPIDEVRFIGNYSTGKMGFQIARAAQHRGADVTLISGPTMLESPRNVHRVDVKTSEEMFNEVKTIYTKFDYIIMAAAVADFKPKNYIKGKIKKTSQEELKIETEKTTDILEFLGKKKNGAKLVGFALETENEISNAKEKLKKKNLDMIVLNNPRTKGAGFGTDTNVVTIIDKALNMFELGKMTKYEIANIILDKISA
jgi:phosphopantothenoylcysteine decarboxylase/phosphopantothenate--cysteine ligase